MDATVSEYPAVIGALREGGSRTKGQSCTGSVVGPRHILIAAHCADLTGTKTFLYGLDDLAVGTGTTLTTKTYEKHPKYINFDQGYDVAVVTTNEDIPVPPEKWAKFATSADVGSWKIGDQGLSFGYGKKTHDDVPSDVSLDKQNFPIVDGATQCQGVGAGFKAETMICAGYPDGRTTILPGDSGGPLVVNGKLVGVASWSRSDFKWYGIWARLDNDMGDWVKSKVPAAPVEFGVTVNPASLTLAAGTSGSVGVNTTVGSAVEDVTLSVSGLPSGVEATLQPTSIKTGEGAKLSFTVAAGTPDGTHRVTVEAKTASATKQATVTLTVGQGSPGTEFGIGLSPSSVSVVAGKNISTTVTSTVSGGTPADISLTASGLPSGAQAVFQPTSIKSGTNAKLTVTTASTTPTGTYQVKVTGTSGSVSHDTTLTLSVTGGTDPQPGALTVALSPSSGSTIPGGSVFSTVSVTGATTAVTLSATGVPSGVTAQFYPATVSPGQTSQLFLTTSFSVAPGIYKIRVNANGDGKSGGADFILTVT